MAELIRVGELRTLSARSLFNAKEPPRGSHSTALWWYRSSYPTTLLIHLFLIGCYVIELIIVIPKHPILEVVFLFQLVSANFVAIFHVKRKTRSAIDMPVPGYCTPSESVSSGRAFLAIVVNMSVTVTRPPRPREGMLQRDSTESGRQNRKSRALTARAGKFDIFSISALILGKFRIKNGEKLYFIVK